MKLMVKTLPKSGNLLAKKWSSYCESGNLLAKKWSSPCEEIVVIKNDKFRTKLYLKRVVN